MQTLKTLITIIGITFFLAFMDGAFYLGFGEAFYVLAGFVQLICIIWALKIVYTNE